MPIGAAVMPEKFSYDGLFAAGVPEVVPGKTRHARYDFAVAYPNPDTLPLDGLADAVRSVLSREGRDLAYYTDPGGYLPLRELVAERLRVSRNMQVDPEESGADRRLWRGHIHGHPGPHRPRRHRADRGVPLPRHPALPAPLQGQRGGHQVRRGWHHPQRPRRHHPAAQGRGPQGQVPLHHPHLPEPARLDHDAGAAQEGAGSHPATRGPGVRGRLLH